MRRSLSASSLLACCACCRGLVFLVIWHLFASSQEVPALLCAYRECAYLYARGLLECQELVCSFRRCLHVCTAVCSCVKGTRTTVVWFRSLDGRPRGASANGAQNSGPLTDADGAQNLDAHCYRRAHTTCANFLQELSLNAVQALLHRSAQLNRSGM